MLVNTYDKIPVEVVESKNDSFVLIQGKYFRVSNAKRVKKCPKLYIVKFAPSSP